MALKIKTPVGRLVQGSPYTPQTTDSKGVPLVIKTGPNAGKPRSSFFMALAIEKTNPEWPAFYAALFAEGRQGYPQHFDAQGNCTHPRFTLKVSDGDGIDNNGKPNASKEGWAGHWIVKFGGSYAPKIVANGALETQEGYVKNGHYVVIHGSAAPNIGSDVPGLYLNPDVVELIGYGPVIQGGIDAVALVAAAPKAAYMPAGMSATPLAPVAGQQAPTMVAQPQHQQPAMQAPGYGMAAPTMVAPPQHQPAMQAPNHAFVQNALAQAPGMVAQAPVMAAPVPPMMAPPPAAAPVYHPTAAAQGHTLDAWLAQGYTHDALVTGGIFTRG